MTDVEELLRAHLHRRAEAAPGGAGGADPLAAIHHRAARRERARHVRRGIAGVAVAVVVVAVAASLVGEGDGAKVATQPGGDGLAHLVFDVPGYPPVRASEDVPAAGGPGGPATGSIRLSVFADGAKGYDGRVLFIETVMPDTPFGLGELDLGAERVAVGASTGYLRQATGGPVWTLGWKLPGGQGVRLTGLRLERADLLSYARALSVDSAGAVSWAGGVPPALTLQRTTVTPFDPRATAEVASAAGLRLSVQAGGPEVADSLILDRVSGALEVSAVTVGGQPAVFTGSEALAGLGTTSLIWQPQPGVVAELRADGDARRVLVAAAESVRPATDAEWRRLLAAPETATTAPPNPAGQVTGQLCARRAAWLTAQATGDTVTADKSRASLEVVWREASAAGLGRDSDLLVVLRTLIDAMNAGDVARVRATPGGGCP